MRLRLVVLRRGRQAMAAMLPFAAYRIVRGAWRRARLVLPPTWLATEYAGIPGPVHDEDYMLDGPDEAAVRRYVATGQQAVDVLGRALKSAGRDWPGVGALLDYGSGYGRVLRWVRERHPHVVVTAADVNRQAVAFCAAGLGAVPLPVSHEVDRLVLGGPYDAIWVGSVLTHLTGEEGGRLLAKLSGSLTPGGVLTFTTHGRLLPHRIPGYGPRVAPARREIEETLGSGGVFYIPAGSDMYAVTFHAPESVRLMVEATAPPLELLDHVPLGWDDHHDVWSCRRLPAGP